MKQTEYPIENFMESREDIADKEPCLISYDELCEDFRRDLKAYIDTQRAESIAEGIAIGEAYGQINGKIDTLIRILTKRLGNLPEELTEKLTRLTDLAEIDRLLDIALDNPTLDKLMKNL